MLPRRGRYRVLPQLEISDLLGFTGAPLALPGPEDLLVVPRPVEPRALPPSSSPAHDTAEILPRPREDGLDVRQYFPGDDPRRISWKLYAHTGGLYLRTGSEARRPVGSALCILDVSSPAGRPREPSAGTADRASPGSGAREPGGPDGLEPLVGLFAGGVLQLASRGVECLVLLPAGSFPVAGDAESRRMFLRRLVDPEEETGPGAEPVPGRLPGDGPVYLFSRPGAAGQDALIRRAAEAGREVHLLLQESREPEPSAHRPAGLTPVSVQGSARRRGERNGRGSERRFDGRRYAEPDAREVSCPDALKPS